MTGLRSILLLVCFWSFGMMAQAADSDVVELPQEELAKESVLPVFEHPISVKNRNIVTTNRFGLDLMYGQALSEPIYNVSRMSLSGYYNTSEDNAFGLVFIKNFPGVSTYANQLHSQFGLDFSRAPAPTQTLLLDWEAKLFYGKMSLTKSVACNLTTYTSLEGGMAQFQNKSYPTIAPGIGQKFYFNKSLALKIDLHLFMGNAPIPFLNGALKDGTQSGGKVDPTPSYADFQDRMTYTTVLDLGLSWLL